MACRLFPHPSLEPSSLRKAGGSPSWPSLAPGSSQCLPAVAPCHHVVSLSKASPVQLGEPWLWAARFLIGPQRMRQVVQGTRPPPLIGRRGRGCSPGLRATPCLPPSFFFGGGAPPQEVKGICLNITAGGFILGGGAPCMTDRSQVDPGIYPGQGEKLLAFARMPGEMPG